MSLRSRPTSAPSSPRSCKAAACLSPSNASPNQGRRRPPATGISPITDIYDTLLDQQQARRPRLQRPAIDIYDQILDGEAPGGAARDAAGAGHGDQDPARARRLCARAGKSTGLPVEIVERNFDECSGVSRSATCRTSPAARLVLARQMMDPEFAKLAHQDPSR